MVRVEWLVQHFQSAGRCVAQTLARCVAGYQQGGNVTTVGCAQSLYDADARFIIAQTIVRQDEIRNRVFGFQLFGCPGFSP